MFHRTREALRSWSKHTVVTVVIGSFLIFAALLKGFSATAANLSAFVFLAARPLQIAALEWELLLGLTLIAGVLPRTAWLAALGTFFVFGAASLWLALNGEVQCACLGRFSSSPWIMLAIDIAAILLLCLGGPSPVCVHHTMASRRFGYRALLFLWALIGAPTGLLLGSSHVGNGPLAEGQSVSSSLRIAPESLNFGEIREQDGFPLSLRIENSSHSDVAVAIVKASCSCMHCEPSSFVVPGNGSADFQVTIDLASANTMENGKTVRPFSQQIAAFIQNQPTATAVWTVSGQVRKHAVTTPQQLSFTDAPAENVQQVVRVKALEELRQVAVECDVAWATARLIPSRASGDLAEYDVEVTRSRDVLPGAYSGHVVIHSAGRDGKQRPAIRVPLEMNILGDVIAVPGELRLGISDISSTSESFITLRSRAGEKFAISSIHSPSDCNLTVDESPVESTARNVRVVQRISQLGEQRCVVSIAIQTQSPNGTTSQVILLPISYYGVGASE